WAEFYRAREGVSYWVDIDDSWLGDTEMSEHAPDFLAALNEAASHGLDINEYPVKKLEELLDSPPEAPADLAEVEIAMMSAYLRYYRHLTQGRYPKLAEKTGWFIKHRDYNEKAALQLLAEKGPHKALQEALPSVPEYELLRKARPRMLRIAQAGGWPKVEGDGLVRPGERSPEIPNLRERLAISGELTNAEPQGEAVNDPNLFDPATVAAFKAFQERHGIKVDGVIGPNARAMLSYPAKERLAQIDANLERLRWMPQHLEDDRIMVNIAAYYFRGYRDGEVDTEMRVVVGDEQHQTPAFSDKLEYMEVNPYWTVPNSIIINELAPKLVENPDYLAARNMSIYENWDYDSELIDPASIDWDEYAHSGKNFPYVIRQAPGLGNALGRIKFMFPNDYSIYLHDTPEDELFKEADRTFSHGCIRLERPIDVADFVLRNTANWDVGRVKAALQSMDNISIALNEKDRMPVYIYYVTAWADEVGELYFRPDLYKRDALLIDAFRKTKLEAQAASEE
ncbi:MAG: L,D-transpeptidase family protein, partial [Salinisphaeraceae bacterium]|nr:L,D-transpeptidase family protein [Salinisphaeraceae bacterium]